MFKYTSLRTMFHPYGKSVAAILDNGQYLEIAYDGVEIGLYSKENGTTRLFPSDEYYQEYKTIWENRPNRPFYTVQPVDSAYNGVMGVQKFENLREATLVKYAIEKNQGIVMSVIDPDGYIVSASELKVQIQIQANANDANQE